MPDGAFNQDFTYRPAVRGNSGCLIMLAGGSGTGKTYTALLLARGLAGPNGKICMADTENRRGLYYADDFKFDHLDLQEPFRPARFEQAAVHALNQGANVWICDNFSWEHSGPGGVLDYFEEEMARMISNARRNPRNNDVSDYELRDKLQFAAWIKPKTEHKHMLQRLWQLNCHVILACAAQEKMDLEAKDNRGRIKPKKTLRPICGDDIPYAMTISFLLADVAKPGMATVIKPLLPALRPLIDLSKPLDEATGARIAAWARGEKPGQDRQPKSASTAATSKPAAGSAPPEESREPEAGGREPAPEKHESESETSQPQGQPGQPAGMTEPPPEATPPTEEDAAGGPPADPPPDNGEDTRRQEADAKAEAKVKELVDLFGTTETRQDHFALVDNPEHQKAIDWLRKARKELYQEKLDPVIKASWQRTDPKQAGKPTQSDLGLGGQNA